MLTKCKNHISSVDETYFQHLRFASKYGLACFQAGFMALVHALLPCCFETAASDKVKKLAGCVEKDKRQDFASS